MVNTIVLDDESARLLTLLTEEEGITPQAYIARMVKKDDQNRHVSWSRRKREFIRVKCNFSGCKETNTQPEYDQAD